MKDGRPIGPLPAAGAALLLLAGASLLLLSGCASRKQPQPAPDRAAAPSGRSYVFAWPFLDPASMQVRGGTTKGPEVALAAAPSEAWKRLRAPGLSAYERDRAAILAMAGDYRASFDFLETAVFPPMAPAALAADSGRKGPARPYRSWGTERIHVVADTGGFISLQHIMVMFFEDAKGVRQEPVVIKHWRQDWRYQPEAVSEHRGRGAWARRTLDAAERKGAWSQSVYHVDDSPRYASVGRWEHNPSFSAWSGGATRRPLPRREHTARSDYHAIEGRNRHSILPAGWLHEQDNLKLVLAADGNPDAAAPYLAREAGVDRYDLIAGFDFSAGDAYWKGTAAFWSGVRDRWTALLSARERVLISDSCRGEPVFSAFFSLADSTAGPKPPPPPAVAASLDSLFACIVSDAPKQ